MDISLQVSGKNSLKAGSSEFLKSCELQKTNNVFLYIVNLFFLILIQKNEDSGEVT